MGRPQRMSLCLGPPPRQNYTGTPHSNGWWWGGGRPPRCGGSRPAVVRVQAVKHARPDLLVHLELVEGAVVLRRAEGMGMGAFATGCGESSFGGGGASEWPLGQVDVTSEWTTINNDGDLVAR